jgi:hypothetical protein
MIIRNKLLAVVVGAGLIVLVIGLSRGRNEPVMQNSTGQRVMVTESNLQPDIDSSRRGEQEHQLKAFHQELLHAQDPGQLGRE